MNTNNFSPKLEEKLVRTPAWIDDMIMALNRMEEHALQAQRAFPNGTRHKHVLDVVEHMREFLLEKVRSGIQDIESFDELDLILAEFLTIPNDSASGDWVNRTARLMEDIFMEAKSARFAEELSDANFQEQVAVNNDDWRRIEREEGFERVGNLQLYVAHEVIDLFERERSTADIMAIKERANSQLRLLLLERDGMRDDGNDFGSYRRAA